MAMITTQDVDRPPEPWMQFVVDSFRDECGRLRYRGVSFEGTSVILEPGSEVDDYLTHFPLQVSVTVHEAYYFARIRQAPAPLQFVAEILRAVLIVPAEEELETELWSQPGTRITHVYSVNFAGSFASHPDELASRVLEIILADWRKYFGDDGSEDEDADGPPTPPALCESMGPEVRQLLSR